MIDVPYIKTTYVANTKAITFNCTIDSTAPGGTRQTILLFGTANALPVYGMITVRTNTTKGEWIGTDTVTSVSLSGKKVTVNLSNTPYDYFTLISALEIS